MDHGLYIGIHEENWSNLEYNYEHKIDKGSPGAHSRKNMKAMSFFPIFHLTDSNQS